MGSALIGCGHPRHAVRIWAAFARQQAECGFQLEPGAQADFDRDIADARAKISNETTFDRIWREGYALTVDQAFEFVRSLDI
jgi:hypothetical protein